MVCKCPSGLWSGNPRVSWSNQSQPQLADTSVTLRGTKAHTAEQTDGAPPFIYLIFCIISFIVIQSFSENLAIMFLLC